MITKSDMSNDTKTTAIAKPPATSSLITRFAERYGVDANKMMKTLQDTCFRVKKKDNSVREITTEQMMALLIVADQYKLNPFTKEIYAFPQDDGIVPIVSVDGWCRIINEHPQMDGIDFEYGPVITPDVVDGKMDGVPVNDSITCCIHRKDRTKPIKITEYIGECRKNSIPWGTHPRRMLRHKALIQCARVAFGFGGIYDEDEALQIIGHKDEVETLPPIQTGRITRATAKALPNEALGAALDDMQTIVPIKQVRSAKDAEIKKQTVKEPEPEPDTTSVGPDGTADESHNSEIPAWVATTLNELDNSPKPSTTESIGNRLITEFRSPETPEPDKIDWYPVLLMAWAAKIGKQSAPSDRPRLIKKLEGWRNYLGSLYAKVFAEFAVEIVDKE